MDRYKTIVYFTDLRDKGHPYNVGDPFPREGVTVSDERIAELSGSNNRRRQPLIEKIEERPEVPKKTPGKRSTKKKE